MLFSNLINDFNATQYYHLITSPWYNFRLGCYVRLILCLVKCCKIERNIDIFIISFNNDLRETNFCVH